MEFLQMVKDKQQAYDVIFEPLQEIINVLTIYEVEFPEKTLTQLQELPERWGDSGIKKLIFCSFYRWAATKRNSVVAKQRVAPLQGQEIGKLKDRYQNKKVSNAI